MSETSCLKTFVTRISHLGCFVKSLLFIISVLPTDNGFVCKRIVHDTDPKTPKPTEVFNGYCPAGYFGLGLSGKKFHSIDVTGLVAATMF